MTDYSELVKALRCCIPYPPEKCVGCTYNIGNNECAVRMMMLDAAAAIEDLQKDLTTLQKCYEIADTTVDKVAKQLPKRGEWIRHPEVKNIYGCEYIECPFCGKKYVVQYIADEKFCRNCGADLRAKMEVQDGSSR